jgi:hypothetical protein
MNGIPKKQRLHPEKIDCFLPIIELLGFIPQGEMILPNARTMRLGPRWCSARGSQGLASLLLSPAIQTVEIAFNAGLTSTVQVLAYFETLVQRASQLRTLRVLYQAVSGQRYFSVIPTMRDLPPVVSLLKKLDHLTDLTLDSAYSFPQMFDILGTFPRLKHIDVQIYIDSNAYSYPLIRTGMFPILERLTITAELAAMGGFVASYLSRSTPAGSLLKVFSVPSPLRGLKQESFLFLAELSPSLNEIRLNGQGDSVFSECHLMQVARCRNLTLLKVESIDNYFPCIRKDKFRDAMASLRNLQCLHLTRGRYPAYMRHHLASSPSQIPTAEFSGPDLSFLGLIAEELPQLESLVITLNVCDTSQFNLGHIVSKFDALKELFFSTPFLNWRIPSFDNQRAVDYIISLLQPRTKFTCDPVIYKKTPRPTEEWVQFIVEYSSFVEAFERQVLDGINELYTLSRSTS